MKIIGDKLRIARQLRNKTITQLAAEVEVSKQAISQFESELSEPKGETVIKICRSLDFPVYFFVKPFSDDVCVTNCFFRALNSTSALEKNSYFEKAKLVGKLYKFLDENLYLPKLNLPEYALPDSISDEFIESLSLKVREYWGVSESPIWNVIALMEENGIILSILKDESKKIDGFTQVYKSDNDVQYCVILEDEKHSMPRRNFSAAHELGHILLHSNINYEELDVSDRANVERQANLFASSFLLPKTKFIKELNAPLNFDLYVTLKAKWHVSIKAMIMRAKELGLLDYYQSISLFKKYNYKITKSNKEGEKFEPLDDVIDFEKPELFETAFEMLLEDGEFDYDSLMNTLSDRGLSFNDEFLYSILPFSENFFDKYKLSNRILDIRIKRKS